MLKKFIHGMLFGAGFSIAFIAIWSVYIYLLIPGMIANSQPTTKLSQGKPVEVIPIDPNAERKYSLHIHPYSKMEVPDGGGILSIAIIEAPEDSKRPSTFQVWLTENNIYKIRTDGESPIVEEISYPDTDPVEYLNDLVRKNAGFRKGNSKMTIDINEVQRLKNGQKSLRDKHLNGSLRITTDGVVFFIPNEYET